MTSLIPFNQRSYDLLNNRSTGWSNMLDNFFSDSWPFMRSLAGDTFKIDVQETDKEYVVEAELPGVRKEEINLAMDEGRLKICINREENLDDNHKNYLHKERRFSSMTRHIFLADADCQSIKAKLEEGLLTITVPKQAKADRSTLIDIQ